MTTALLILLAALAAWRPVEVYPWSGPLIGLGLLALLPWAWRRRGRVAPDPRVVTPLITVVLISLVVGLDRQAGLAQLVLFAGAAALGWCAARRPSDAGPQALAVVLALLAAWGLYQLLWGFSAAEASLSVFPEPFRQTAAARLATHRAFASLGLPGHLAVLLVTALPLLIETARTGRWRWPARLLVVLDLAGLAATRSLAGVGLAALVVVAVSGRRLRRALAVCLVVVMVAVAAGRSDLRTLEPVVQRIDNARTALWAWSTSPVLGVGPGGLRQAGQRTPFPVRSVSAYAHNLLLQALAEMGPVGLLVVVWGYVLVFGLVRDRWSDRRSLAVAVAVVPLHNLVDFSAYVSGVLLPWSLLLGWMAARREKPEVATPGRRTTWIPAMFGAVLVLASCLHAASRSMEAAAADHASFSGAVSAHRLAPWRVEPCLLAGAIALERPTELDIVRARQLVDHARRIRPRSGHVELLAARLAVVAGEPLTAVERARAARLNRPGWRPAVQLENELLTALEEMQ